MRQGRKSEPFPYYKCISDVLNIKPPKIIQYSTFNKLPITLICTYSGLPTIVSLSFSQQESALVCVSSGGPATTVEWKRDNVSLTEANNTESDYQQIQAVLNTETATYENKLISSNITNLIGTFTCTVSNIRGSAKSSLTIDGMP